MEERRLGRVGREAAGAVGRRHDVRTPLQQPGRSTHASPGCGTVHPRILASRPNVRCEHDPPCPTRDLPFLQAVLLLTTATVCAVSRARFKRRQAATDDSTRAAVTPPTAAAPAREPPIPPRPSVGQPRAPPGSGGGGGGWSSGGSITAAASGADGAHVDGGSGSGSSSSRRGPGADTWLCGSRKAVTCTSVGPV